LMKKWLDKKIPHRRSCDLPWGPHRDVCSNILNDIDK